MNVLDNRIPESMSEKVATGAVDLRGATSELFANGPHIGTVAFEIGDPGLGIERSNGLELNLKKRSGYTAST